MISAAREFNPEFLMPEDVGSAIAHGRMETAVQACLARAEGLQADGQLPAALSEVERTLAAYPDAPGLGALQQELRAKIRARREQLIQELLAIEGTALTARTASELQDL